MYQRRKVVKFFKVGSLGDEMQYLAGLFVGIAASALFGLLDRFFLTLPSGYDVAGMVACFAVFGVSGYFISLRFQEDGKKSSRFKVFSKVRTKKNIKGKVDGVKSDGKQNTDVGTDLKAKGNIDVDFKNIKTGK